MPAVLNLPVDLRLRLRIAAEGDGNRLEAAVGKEAARQSSLDFKVTGPWPPYDFVRMQFGG